MFQANLTANLLLKNNVILGVKRQLINWPVNYYFFVEIFKSLPNFPSLANSVYHELNYETKYGNTAVRGTCN